jgi:hypothetical protein
MYIYIDITLHMKYHNLDLNLVKECAYRGRQLKERGHQFELGAGVKAAEKVLMSPGGPTRWKRKRFTGYWWLINYHPKA